MTDRRVSVSALRAALTRSNGDFDLAHDPSADYWLVVEDVLALVEAVEAAQPLAAKLEAWRRENGGTLTAGEAV